MTDPVGTDRARFEAWLQTDGGRRAVAQIIMAFQPRGGLISEHVSQAIKSSLWDAYVHAWNAALSEPRYAATALRYFTLNFTHDPDGDWTIRSPEVRGLFLSAKDVDALMSDLAICLADLLWHNHATEFGSRDKPADDTAAQLKRIADVMEARWKWECEERDPKTFAARNTP